MNLELVEHDRLGELAATVNDEYALMTGDMTRAVKRAIRIGELLTEVKAEVAHGEWIPWVEENLVFGQREARRYMRVAANASRVTHFDSLREAVSLLAEPKEEEPADESGGSASCTADKYRKLYIYRDKIPSSGNLQDAYRDSAQIESREKQSE